MIRVLELFTELRLLTPLLLLLAPPADTAERVFRPDDLPDRPAVAEDALFAELRL